MLPNSMCHLRCMATAIRRFCAIAIGRDVPIVVTEGNYLLLHREPWTRARSSMTAVWFLDVPDDLRLARLVARHERHGRTPAEARAWVAGVDEPNAQLVASTRDRADLVVRLLDQGAG